MDYDALLLVVFDCFAPSLPHVIAKAHKATKTIEVEPSTHVSSIYQSTAYVTRDHRVEDLPMYEF
jgi:hypothetical protein